MKQSKYPSATKWIKKLRYSQAMYSFSAIKMNTLLYMQLLYMDQSLKDFIIDTHTQLRKKIDTKDEVLFNSIYMTFEKGKIIGRKISPVIITDRNRNRRLTINGTGHFLR